MNRQFNEPDSKKKSLLSDKLITLSLKFNLYEAKLVKNWTTLNQICQHFEEERNQKYQLVQTTQTQTRGKKTQEQFLHKNQIMWNEVKQQIVFKINEHYQMELDMKSDYISKLEQKIGLMEQNQQLHVEGKADSNLSFGPTQSQRHARQIQQIKISHQSLISFYHQRSILKTQQIQEYEVENATYLEAIQNINSTLELFSSYFTTSTSQKEIFESQEKTVRQSNFPLNNILLQTQKNIIQQMPQNFYSKVETVFFDFFQEKVIQLQSIKEELQNQYLQNKVLRNKFEELQKKQEERIKLCAVLTQTRLSEIEMLRNQIQKVNQQKVRVHIENQALVKEIQFLKEDQKRTVYENHIKPQNRQFEQSSDKMKQNDQFKVREQIDKVKKQNMKQIQEIQYLKNHIQMMVNQNKHLEKQLSVFHDQVIKLEKTSIEIKKQNQQTLQYNKQLQTKSQEIYKELFAKDELALQNSNLHKYVKELESSQPLKIMEEKQIQTQSFKEQKILQINTDFDHRFIDDIFTISPNNGQKVSMFKNNQSQQKKHFKEESINSKQTIQQGKQKLEQESHNNFMNHESNSVYNADIHFLNLSEENKKLKTENTKLHNEIKKLSESVLKIQNFGDQWKNIKKQGNQKNPTKLIQAARLKQKIQIILSNKQKVLKQFDHNDFQALCSELSLLIQQTKEWVQLLDSIASEGKKKALITHPKLLKRKTHRLAHHKSKQIDYQRSVYSQGNTPKKESIQFDLPPFEMQMNEVIIGHPNSLQRMFSDHKQLSDISSVKHQSQNSDFLHSKSQIVKIFEKQGMKFKKDIVDEYMHPISSKILHHQKKISPLPNSLSKCDLGKKFEEKSNKSKRKVINKTVKKIKLLENQLDETKKQYKKIMVRIMEQYQLKLKKMEKQFEGTMQKLIKISNKKNEEQCKNQIFAKSPSKSITDLHRIGSPNKDLDLLKQKNEQLKVEIQQKIQNMDQIQKLLDQKLEVISQLEKKNKEEKSILQKTQKQYQKQKKYNTELKLKYNQMRKQFGQFMKKLAFRNKKQVKGVIEVSIQTDSLQNIEKESKIKYDAVTETESWQRSKEQFQNDQRINKNKKLKEQILQNIKEISQSLALQEKFQSLQEVRKAIKDQFERVNSKVHHYENCLFMIIKQIILQFQISQEYFDRIINEHSCKNNWCNFHTFRQFLQSIYQKQAGNLQLFDSYASKIQKCSKQLFEKEQILEEKRRQIQKLNEKQKFIKLNKNISNQSLKSLKSQGQQFYEFTDKQQFDNTKPLCQEIQLLTKQLQIYKEKCKEYESNLHPKKKQVIYIRK